MFLDVQVAGNLEDFRGRAQLQVVQVTEKDTGLASGQLALESQLP